MKASRASLLPAAVLAITAATTTDLNPPPALGPRGRNRRFYDPSTRPFPPRHDRPAPTYRKKKPHSTADFAAIGKAVAKRERKAERRLRTEPFVAERPGRRHV